MTSLWKNYDANSSYDEYLTPEKKLRREAKIISSILDKHGKKNFKKLIETAWAQLTPEV